MSLLDPTLAKPVSLTWADMKAPLPTLGLKPTFAPLASEVGWEMPKLIYIPSVVGFHITKIRKEKRITPRELTGRMGWSIQEWDKAGLGLMPLSVGKLWNLTEALRDNPKDFMDVVSASVKTLKDLKFTVLDRDTTPEGSVVLHEVLSHLLRGKNSDYANRVLRR